MNAIEKIEPSNVVPIVQASNPMALLEAAIDKGVSIEVLEKIMGLQERWEANTARTAYGEAMNKAQAEMRPVSTDASNPQTKSKFASYHALDSAIRPIYIKHGFSLSFDTADGAPVGEVRIVCNIQHVSGHCKQPHLDMPADGKGAKGGDVMTKTHATGAAITYGRRYLLGMIFNIAVGDDTDGNAREKLVEGSETITPDEFIFLNNLMTELGAIESKVLASVKAISLETMTQRQFREATAKLQAWAKKVKQNATAQQ